MKIAIFTDCYLDLTGGIVSSIDADKAELERRGHTVYIFSSGYPRSEAELRELARQNIYPVKSCRIIGRGLTPIARRPGVVEKQVMREHPEIRNFDLYYIHYEAGCSIAGLRLAHQNNVRSLQVMHGREDVGESKLVPWGLRTVVAVLLNWFHSWYIPHLVRVRRDDYLADTLAKAKMWTLMVNHANYADVVATPSQHFRKKLQHYGVTRPFEVLPHGLADDLCKMEVTPRRVGVAGVAPGRTDARAKSSEVETIPEESGETVRMIWHSRLSGEKRIMEFLEAIRRLEEMRRNDVPGTPMDGGTESAKSQSKTGAHKTDAHKTAVPLAKYHLDIYGGGPEEKRARNNASKYRLPVTFHGNTAHEIVWQELQKADLDILASYNFDNYSMTLVEAVVAGAPAFIVDPDMEEILPKGGYILASGPSPEAMATALAELLTHPERIAKMSRAAIRGRDAKRISRKIDKLEQMAQALENKK